MPVKTSPANIRDEAFTRIPDYHATNTALAHATQWEKTLYAERAAFRPITADTDAALREAAYNQGELPRDAGKAEREAVQEREDHAALLARVSTLKEHLKVTLEATLKDHAGTALTYLNGELRTLAADVATNAADLTGLEDLETIVKEGGPRLKAWQQLAGYLERYDTIRATQREIVTRSLRNDVGDAGSRWLYTVGLLADALDKDAHWINARNSNYRGGYSHRVMVEHNDWLSMDTTGKPSWPSTLEHRDWFPTPKREAYLLWVCTQATPWVPTLDQLRDAHDAATSAVQSVSTLNAAEYALNARKRYAEITGTN